MNDYRYILQPYNGRNSRHRCPGCNEPHQFSRYIYTDTGESVADHVGKCNRINKCGYHYSPQQFFSDNNFLPYRGDVRPLTDREVSPPTYINKAIFLKSLADFANNNFVKYLHSRFNTETVKQMTIDYNIGTSSRWNGGTTIFWQVDIKGKVRTGKLIKYNPESGKRIKFNTGSLTNWAHSVLSIDDFNLKQCFFGEHLLSKYPDKVVGIVESEKTAIFASVFLPQLVWLASGGANGINKEKVKVLRSREVILFPDASSSGEIFNNWHEVARKYGFTCSDFIEKNASKDQKIQGIDIADLLKNVVPVDKSGNKTKIPHPFNKYPSIATLIDELSLEIIEKIDDFEPYQPTPQIPYNTPSPVALIDSKIDTKKVFNKEDLVVKSRVFTTTSGDNIELVGLRDYGFCKNWESHKKQKGHCKECILNCLHTIKINGKLQKREYSQLEVLLMQERTT